VQITVNGRLTDRTTAGDLILLQSQTEPQAQDFFHFSHGHTLLGHEVSSTPCGIDFAPLVSSAACFD
jgi:hypothetical protein